MGSNFVGDVESVGLALYGLFLFVAVSTVAVSVGLFIWWVL